MEYRVSKSLTEEESKYRERGSLSMMEFLDAYADIWTKHRSKRFLCAAVTFAVCMCYAVVHDIINNRPLEDVALESLLIGLFLLLLFSAAWVLIENMTPSLASKVAVDTGNSGAHNESYKERRD